MNRSTLHTMVSLFVDPGKQIVVQGLLVAAELTWADRIFVLPLIWEKLTVCTFLK